MSLYKKLFDLRAEVGAVSKNSTNPFFKSKYFDINELLEHLQPHLDKHKLLLLQPIRNSEVGTEIIDIESGDSVSAFMPLSASSNPQDMGKEVTYFRRFTLQSLLGMRAEDDDGNTASRASKKTQLKEGTEAFEKVREAMQKGYTLAQVKSKYNVSPSTAKALQA